jgi:uncharacterized protein DUF5670
VNSFYIPPQHKVVFIEREETAMSWKIGVILIAMWVLRTLSSYTMNGFMNILLVIAIVTLLLRLISGRQVGAGTSSSPGRDVPAARRVVRTEPDYPNKRRLR